MGQARIQVYFLPADDLLVHVCPMGVDYEHLSPRRREKTKREALLAAFRNTTHAGENIRLLLYVGRISREKNISLLLEMMELLADQTSADYRLLVVGAGPLANWLEANAERRVPRAVWNRAPKKRWPQACRW